MKNIYYDGDGPVGQFLRENFYPDYSYKGIVMDVGGGEAERYSFSKHFIDNGWRGIIFEPNDKYYLDHKNAGHEIYQYAVSNRDEKNIEFTCYFNGDEMGSPGLGYKGPGVIDPFIPKRTITVDMITLNTFFKENNLKEVDLLSVDVEGWELEVMEGFDTNLYSAKFIVLENFYHLDTYNATMAKKGYQLINKISFNYIYKKL
jgi:FkbM family methyltransferase